MITLILKRIKFGWEKYQGIKINKKDLKNYGSNHQKLKIANELKISIFKIGKKDSY